MNIASWNIAGGRTFRGSHSEALAADYDQENLDYFVQVLKTVNPQFVALQETHSSLDSSVPSQSQVIAEQLGMDSMPAYPYGPSHIDQDKYISLGTLSSFPIKGSWFHGLPNPNLTVHRPDGQVWNTLNMGFTVSEVDMNGTLIRLVNGHLYPLHYFGRSYLEPDFQNLRDDMSAFLTKIADVPSIVAADFNFADLTQITPDIFNNGLYQEAFHESTTPSKGQQDHILLSRHWAVEDSGVKKVDADHYLCVVGAHLR